MPHHKIRSSHLYLYDSTIGQQELARENYSHTKLIVTAKAKVDTESPKFWIPNVGSPLRLTRPHSGAVRPAKAKEMAQLMQQQRDLVERQRLLRQNPNATTVLHGKIRPQTAGPTRGQLGPPQQPVERKKKRSPPSRPQSAQIRRRPNPDGSPRPPSAALLSQSGAYDDQHNGEGEPDDHHGGDEGISPFRQQRGGGGEVRVSPARSRYQRRQQQAMQRALERDMAEERHRKEEWAAAQERGKTKVANDAARHNQSCEIPMEYGKAHQHLVYHAEDVIHSTEAAAPPATGVNVSSSSRLAGSSAIGGGLKQAESYTKHNPMKASHLATMASNVSGFHQSFQRKYPSGTGTSGVTKHHPHHGAAAQPASAVAQHIVEQFIDFCVDAFDYSEGGAPHGDQECARLLSHVTREIEERRLLALHRQSMGFHSHSATVESSYPPGGTGTGTGGSRRGGPDNSSTNSSNMPSRIGEDTAVGPPA